MTGYNSTMESQRFTADELLEAVHALPESERLRLIERVVHELAVARERGQPAPANVGTTLVGLWRADADMVDEMVENTMAGREERALRASDA